MSTFLGIPKEYPFISIDRFDNKNLNSLAYFLSHCHEDHMVGLDKDMFYERLVDNPNVKIYCSKVTKALLVMDKRFARLKHYLIEIPLEQPLVLNMECNHMSVTVTLISAAHCPGSAMFFFEGCNGNVLYTGDFRIEQSNDCRRISALHTQKNVPKPIKGLYIDTTFCTPNAHYIPSREDCLKELRNIIKMWIGKGSDHKVQLAVSAKYGYEYLFEDLHEKFGMKIHCQHLFRYKRLPDVLRILTDDPSKSQIYVALKNNAKYRSLWKGKEENESQQIQSKIRFLKVTLSTMYFTNVAAPNDICCKISDTHYRLCFSFHSSFSEVCDFVKYFSPENVYANVIPHGDKSEEEVEQRINEVCFKQNTKNEMKFNKLGSLKWKGNFKRSTKLETLSSDEDEDWKELMKAKRRKNLKSSKHCE